MLRSVIGVLNGDRILLKEKVKIAKSANVIVTFLNEADVPLQKNAIIKRLLSRKPVKITPLKIKDLIAEGRK